MTALVHVRDLYVTYAGGRAALRGVSLDLPRGVITVLLGRSGAGKSTLLRCLNHLQTPTSGSVWVEGIGDLDDEADLRKHRRQTGMVFQLHHLIGRQTALDNVLMGRVGHHRLPGAFLPPAPVEITLAMECLDRVGLADRAFSRADRLSGGERQRVGIARALAQQPRLLLADEPVASLDPATAEAVMDLLARVCREDGLTAAVSLHQVELARRYADHVIGLADGRVVFDGPAADLGDDTLDAVYLSSSKGVSDASPFIV
jgi:phosphonate transport system ATP-binding protein